jgi:hypothetical protein
MRPSDRARLDELYPPLRDIAIATFERAQKMLDEREPDRWRVAVFEAHRTPARQMELYKRGRVREGGTWRKVGKTVTNALPHQTPHCVTTVEGDPCALALDLGIVDRVSGTWCPDGHPAWATIPAAAYLAGGDRVDLGAMFSSIAGGDWPHIEWAEWRKLVKGGVLIRGG